MGGTGDPDGFTFSVVRSDGVLAEARLARGPDGWCLAVRAIAPDGRPVGPAQVVCGPPDAPGLAALLRLADPATDG